MGRGAGGEGKGIAKTRQAIVDRILDQTLHTSRILQYVVSRDPQQGVSLFGQKLIASIIVRATFFGSMMLPVDLHDQLQRNTAEVSRIGRDRVLTPKLLLPALSIPDDLPHGVRKLVRASALILRKRNCFRSRRDRRLGRERLFMMSPDFNCPSPPTPLPKQVWARGETEQEACEYVKPTQASARGTKIQEDTDVKEKNRRFWAEKGTLRISQTSDDLWGDLQDKSLSLVAGVIRGD